MSSSMLNLEKEGMKSMWPSRRLIKKEGVTSFIERPPSYQEVEPVSPDSLQDYPSEDDLYQHQHLHRQPKYKRNKRQWTDDEASALIEMWSSHENLYNPKHELYFDKTKRQDSLEFIRSSLQEKGIQASVDEINDKLTNLKTYYGGQRRLIDRSKGEQGEVLTSSWKHFSKLTFLKDAFTPRIRKRSLAGSNRNYKPSCPKRTSMIMPQQATTTSESRCVDLERSNSPSDHFLETPIVLLNQEEDKVFSDLVYKILQQIPESEAKDFAKISVQQLLVRTKHEVSRDHWQQQ